MLDKELPIKALSICWEAIKFFWVVARAVHFLSLILGGWTIKIKHDPNGDRIDEYVQTWKY